MNAILDFFNSIGWGLIAQLLTLLLSILKYFNVL